MKNLILTGLIVLGTALTCGDVQAKSIGKILSQSGLSPEDFDIMTQQAATLYTIANPIKGSTTQWKNDATRSYGTVWLVEMQQNCAALRHLVFPQNAKQGREIRLRRCKTSDGSWILE